MLCVSEVPACPRPGVERLLDQRLEEGSVLVGGPRAEPGVCFCDVARGEILDEGGADEVRGEGRLDAVVVSEGEDVRLVHAAHLVVAAVEQREEDLIGEGGDDRGVCEVADCVVELEVVEFPDAFYEGPEAGFEVDVGCELGGPFGGGFVVRGEVAEEVEDEAVFVVKGYGRFADALVEVAEAAVTLWGVGFSPC